MGVKISNSAQPARGGVTQYIGARYVLDFADPIEWDSARSYEALLCVTHNGCSYVSRQPVPAGVDIEDKQYWLKSFDFNAQFELYRQEVRNGVLESANSANQSAQSAKLAQEQVASAEKAASDSAQSASEASQKATEASQKATDAANSASQAAQSASDAATKATESAASAASAASSASAAETISQKASDSAAAAAESARQAHEQASESAASSLESKEAAKQAKENLDLALSNIPAKWVVITTQSFKTGMTNEAQAVVEEHVVASEGEMKKEISAVKPAEIGQTWLTIATDEADIGFDAEELAPEIAKLGTKTKTWVFYDPWSNVVPLAPTNYSTNMAQCAKLGAAVSFVDQPLALDKHGDWRRSVEMICRGASPAEEFTNIEFVGYSSPQLKCRGAIYYTGTFVNIRLTFYSGYDGMFEMPEAYRTRAYSSIRNGFPVTYVSADNRTEQRWMYLDGEAQHFKLSGDAIETGAQVVLNLIF